MEGGTVQQAKLSFYFGTLRAGRAEWGQLWLLKPCGRLRRPRFTGWLSTPQLAGCEQQSLGRWVQPFLPLGPLRRRDKRSGALQSTLGEQRSSPRHRVVIGAEGRPRDVSLPQTREERSAGSRRGLVSRWANCPGFGAVTVSTTPLAHGLRRPASPCGSVPSVTATESGAWRHLLRAFQALLDRTGQACLSVPGFLSPQSSKMCWNILYLEDEDINSPCPLGD